MRDFLQLPRQSTFLFSERYELIARVCHSVGIDRYSSALVQHRSCLGLLRGNSIKNSFFSLF